MLNTESNENLVVQKIYKEYKIEGAITNYRHFHTRYLTAPFQVGANIQHSSNTEKGPDFICLMVKVVLFQPVLFSVRPIG